MKMKSIVKEQKIIGNHQIKVNGSRASPHPHPNSHSHCPTPKFNDNNKCNSIYQVGYLGSAILTNGKTGLGCLQQPLRELYAKFRQHGSRLVQERRLAISLDGLTMIYTEFGIEKCLHNDLPFVYDVQLLKLTYERKKDKKIYCAFLPIGTNTLIFLVFYHIIRGFSFC
jgi:hypothetical protein